MERGMQVARTANSTFAIGGGSCPLDSFVVKESSVLRMNIGAKKPAHRKSATRCVPILGSVLTLNFRVRNQQFF